MKSRLGRATVLSTLALAGTLALDAPACVEVVPLGSGLETSGTGGAETGKIKPGLLMPAKETSEVTVGGTECHPGLTTDLDGDGFSAVQGDCNDCDPRVGPNAVEMPTENGDVPIDEDCDGVTDEPIPTCDGDLVVDDTSPMAAARAMDLCQTAETHLWGVAKATWVLPDGTTPPISLQYDLGHGILSSFGPNVPVRYGKRLLALSSGTARQPTDPGYIDPRGFDKGIESKPPEGFPLESPACPGIASGPPHDGAALELSIRVPQNAEAFAYDFDFYTYEFPENICSRYNDLFVVLFGDQLEMNKSNICFDSAGNTVSVNSVFLEACSCPGGPPCGVNGRQYDCSLGSAPLVGTGFGTDTAHDGDHGATGWLTTEAPVVPGSRISLRFAIHDSEDGYLDSTVLLDHFRWKRHGEQVPRTYRPQ